MVFIVLEGVFLHLIDGPFTNIEPYGGLKIPVSIFWSVLSIAIIKRH